MILSNKDSGLAKATFFMSSVRCYKLTPNIYGPVLFGAISQNGTTSTLCYLVFLSFNRHCHHQHGTKDDSFPRKRKA